MALHLLTRSIKACSGEPSPLADDLDTIIKVVFVCFLFFVFCSFLFGICVLLLFLFII